MTGLRRKKGRLTVGVLLEVRELFRGELALRFAHEVVVVSDEEGLWVKAVPDRR
jgi:hypothetical protein